MKLRPRLALPTLAATVPMVAALVVLDAFTRHRAAQSELAWMALGAVTRPGARKRCDATPGSWGAFAGAPTGLAQRVPSGSAHRTDTLVAGTGRARSGGVGRPARGVGRFLDEPRQRPAGSEWGHEDVISVAWSGCNAARHSVSSDCA